ncbi:MAG: hypothetical protein AAGF74_03430 [Pseudomonadota bacterium]
MIKTLSLGALVACAAFSAAADEFSPALQAYFEAEVMQWANDPVIAAAIAAQNARTASLSQSDIDEMDARWRAEVGTGNTPTITPVISGEAADYLRARVASSGGVITEVFAMDARGLNVAASAVTSDYWQGDEAKFSATFPNGPGAMHIGDVEFDESSQSYQGQVSVVITDPASGKAIGAMTVGLNAEALM